MHVPHDADLLALYQQTDEHFFSATCPKHRRYGADVSAYLIDEYANPFNQLCVRVGSAPLDGALAGTLDRICHISLPIRVVIHEEQVEGVGELLSTLAFQPVEKTTVMVLELSRFVTARNERFLDVSLTRDLNEWAAPLSSAFSIPPEQVAHYQARHQRALDADLGVQHFTLAVDGRVVSSLTLSIGNGVARLNDFGTVPNARAKGYGTRLLQAVLLHAADAGIRYCFLEATTGAISLYGKLGFERLFDNQAFVRGPMPGI